MNVKDRLKIFIKHNNMSVLAFEKSIQAANGYVNSISKGIGVDKLDFIANKYPLLNLSWLTRGEGEMLKNSIVQENEETTEDAQTAVIGQRLAEYAAMQGVNIKEFAAKCGLNYNNTASLLKGSMPLGLGVLGKIKKGFPALNTEWVLYGNGTIELGGAAPNNAAIEQMQQVVTLLQGSLKDKDKTIAGLEKQVALMEQLQELTDKKDQSPVKSTVG